MLRRSFMAFFLAVALVASVQAQVPCFDDRLAGWSPSGLVDLPGGANTMVATGDGYVLVGGNLGVYVVDVTGSGPPVVTDYKPLTSPVTHVACDAGLMAVVTADERLLTGVLSEPGRITWSGEMVLQFVRSMALDGSVLALLQGNAQLATVDLGDPKNPVYLGWVALPEPTNALAADRGLAFLASESRFLMVYDLADPALPEYLSSGSRFASGTGLAVEYPRVHVANVGKIVTYDVSQPEEPVELGESSRLFGFNRLVAADRGFCITASDEAHLSHLSTTPDAAPVAQGQTLLAEPAVGLAMVQGRAVALQPGGALHVFDPAAGVHPPVVHEISDSIPFHARVADDLLYVLDADSQPSPVLAVSPLSPEGPGATVGSILFFGSPRGLDVKGDRLILATSLTSLALVDVSDPTAPAYISQRGQDVSTDDMAILGNSYCALGKDDFGNETLVVYDVGTGGSLQLATALRMPYGTVQVEGWRDHALVRGRFEMNGLLVVDCRVPSQSHMVDWAALEGDSVDLVASGRYAYVLSTTGQLDVVSLEDPSRMDVVLRLDLGVPTFNGTLALLGNRLLVADTYRGVTVVDISDPEQATVAGAAWVPVTGRLLAGPSAIVLSDPLFNQRSFLPPICGALSGAPLPPTLSLMTLGARPNPFNPRTELVFRLPGSARVDLAVYDLQGRLVRQLLQGAERPAGIQRVSWDGRDEGGRALASAVYLARVRSAGASGSAKLVLVR